MSSAKSALATLVVAAAVSLGAAAHAGDINVLWYTGGVQSGDNNYKGDISALASQGAGDPSTASWNITYWDGGAEPSGSYNVLVIASPQGGWNSYPDYTALDSSGLTLGDRILVTGQDADWHLINGPGPSSFDNPRGFLRNSINWAAGGSGLGVVALGGPTDFLDAYGLTATLGASSGSTDTVVIPGPYAAFPINTNLTSAGLSNWSTSAHDIWSNADTTKWTGINTDGIDGQFVTLVSAATAGGGIVGGPGGAPEPGVWALMMTGVGLLGSALRRARGLTSLAAA